MALHATCGLEGQRCPGLRKTAASSGGASKFAGVEGVNSHSLRGAPHGFDLARDGVVGRNPLNFGAARSIKLRLM